MGKRIIALVLLCLTLWGCKQEVPEPTETTAPREPNNKVGICLPNYEWNIRGQQLQQLLEAAGRQVFLEYALGDPQLQKTQIQVLVDMPVGCLVVAAMDPLFLNEELQRAEKAGIPVIALDRLPLYTQAVTGYVAMDGYAAGQQMARHIIEKKNLEGAEAPVTIELFMGPAEDHNAHLLHKGLMELLQPYFKSGKLICRSGRLEFEETCMSGGEEDAMDRCFNYMTEFYEKGLPDVICAGEDALAQGCVEALLTVGEEPEAQWPLIIGVGSSEETAERIRTGQQSLCLYVDTTALGVQCAQWVLAVAEGTSPGEESCDNGTVQVPCILQKPVAVTEENCHVLP